MRYSIGWVLCLSCLVAAMPVLAKDATSPLAGYDQELQQALALLHQKQYPAAISALERLDQLAGGSCEDCLVLLSNAYTNAGERPEAAAAARRAIGLVSEPEPLAYANAALAFSLLDPQASSRQLAEAETAIRRTLELDKEPSLQHWGFLTLNWILFHRQHYEDMVAAGREYLENHPWSDEAIARKMICVGRNLGNIPGPEESTGPAEHAGGSVRRPQPLYKPKPGYPQSARDAGVEGTVIVNAILDTEGCVVETKILKSLDPDLDQSVLDTLRYWAFKPADLEGQPVKVHYSLTVNFKKEAEANP